MWRLSNWLLNICCLWTLEDASFTTYKTFPVYKHWMGLVFLSRNYNSLTLKLSSKNIWALWPVFFPVISLKQPVLLSCDLVNSGRKPPKKKKKRLKWIITDRVVRLRNKCNLVYTRKCPGALGNWFCPIFNWSKSLFFSTLK